MAGRKREAVTSREVVERVLRAAGTKLVLVGGQALAFWMDHYGVEMPERLPYVSRDIDFLTPSKSDVSEVRRLARVLGGQTVLPNKRALTALVGQAVKHVSDEEFINVDVVFRVLGANDDFGRAQLDAAIQVARGLQREAAASSRQTAKSRGRALAFASRIERLARSDAGRKVARRFGVHVADAIEPAHVANETFRSKKLPQLLPLMSAQRRAEVTARS